MPVSAPSRLFGLRLQFRFQTLLVLMTVIAVAIGMVTQELHYEYRKKKAAANIRALRGSVFFRGSGEVTKQTGVVNGWLRLILGDNYFSSVVSVSYSPQSQAELKLLLHFPELQVLSLKNPSLTLPLLSTVEKLSKLEYLDFRGLQLSESDLRVIANQQQLKSLRFSNCDLPDKLSELTELPLLERLHFDNCDLPENSWQLIGDNRLKYLSFESCSLSERELESIRKIPHLLSLRITKCTIDDTSLRKLHGATSVVNLSLGNVNLSEHGLVLLRKANPNWSIAYQSDTSVPNVYKLPSKLEPAANSSLEYRSSFTTGLTLEFVGELRNLRGLSLFKCDINDQDLRHLHGLQELEWLTLAGDKLTLAGVNELVSQLPKLRQLALYNIHWTDDGLKRLPANLEGLILNMTGITNEQFATLSSTLTSLKTLTIEQSPISDASISHLDSMPELQELHLDGTAISQAGLATLKQSLPNCEIYFYPAQNSPAK